MTAGDDRPGVFTLSLDCEGLWGMADQPQTLSSGVINKDSLRRAYDTVIGGLEANGLRATAAFVTSFAASRAALQECLPLIEQMAARNDEWFRWIVPALRRGDSVALSGWEGSELWDSFYRRGHEMAWHGATHMPLVDGADPEAIELELELAKCLFATLGHTPRTVVFPRNRSGSLANLQNAGFSCYRKGPTDGKISRLGSMAREWNVWDRAHDAKPRIENGWAVSPAGFFLNWPSGPRSMVPVSVTVRRWRSLLRHAVENGGFVHMWFHPHNLITAPRMETTFLNVLREVGDLVRGGGLLNLTMAEANAHYGLGACK